MNTDQHKDVRARTMVSQNKNHHKNQKNMDQDQIKAQDPAKDKEQRSPSTQICAIFRQADLPTVTLLNDPRIACKLGWSY